MKRTAIKRSKKPLPRKSKRPNRRYSHDCDALFSKMVRDSGPCVICGTDQHLQCAHGFSRRYRNVRWDFRNAFPMCRAHHTFFTHRPIEWDLWLRERWGEPLYEELRALALSGDKVDLKKMLAVLQAEAAA